MAVPQGDLKMVEAFHDPTSTPSVRKIEEQGLAAFKDIIFGSTAGILAKYVEYPFDTIKVRLQSQTGLQSEQRLSGPFDAFTAAFRSPEGPLRSLYHGISAPLVGAAVETSSLFFSYRVAQDAWVSISPGLRAQRDSANGNVELPYTALLGCGAVSGAFTSLLLTPIELVKCKMQVPVHNKHGAQLPGPLQIMSTVLRTQGIRGFWHGQLGTLIRETGGSAAWFGSYEGVKLLFLQHDPSLKSVDNLRVWQMLCAGAAAGMSYNFVFYPADTIKSRMQTEDIGLGKSKGSFMAIGRNIWAAQGIKGYYRGCGITVFRAAPSSAIIFTIYEGLKRYFE